MEEGALLGKNAVDFAAAPAVDFAGGGGGGGGGGADSDHSVHLQCIAKESSGEEGRSARGHRSWSKNEPWMMIQFFFF